MEKELRRELEKEENIWSYRRANKRNYYCARQEVLENFEKAYIEVMLDTSGSVSDKLLLSFLSQLKPLIDKDIELRVACFDHEVYAFNVIKKEKDITSMQIVGRGGTNFDEAIKAFSEKKEVNKIIFTDGYCSVKWSDVPKSKRNIIWIIYDNPNYTAKYGRVIYVNSREILSALKDSVDEKNEMVRDR